MMRDDCTTEDYRNAPSGIGKCAAEWNNKPHRLLYDLCGEVEKLQMELRERKKEAKG